MQIAANLSQVLLFVWESYSLENESSKFENELVPVYDEFVRSVHQEISLYAGNLPSEISELNFEECNNEHFQHYTI